MWTRSPKSKLCLGRCPESAESSDADVAIGAVMRLVGVALLKRPDIGPPRLLLAMHGHIETFSKMPQRFYRLFDAPVDLGLFPSGCRRAAEFVTRMGISIQIWRKEKAWGARCPKQKGYTGSRLPRDVPPLLSLCCVGCAELLGQRARLPTVAEEEPALESCVGKLIGDRVGVDNLVIPLGILGPRSVRRLKLGSVLYPVYLFENPRLCIAEAALVCFAPRRLDALRCPSPIL
ncbi:hypothetical protein CRG98_007796 [Punica granatum]|uniref:Uncharacterized protein n=1 Tax=Punica granatum TaxID=22663 RepID=A0A2I0KTZ3_PUNGR|nr:hypothetical protein CRG98_007796 [Punica granatum]